MNPENIVIQRFKESIAVKERCINDRELINMIVSVSNSLYGVIKGENKVILCGNGGSASDALHFAGEIVGRCQKERSAWSAIVLNSDIATMTASGSKEKAIT